MDTRISYGLGLAGFDELSVREEDGAALIRELTGREATVLVDPTLMLTAEEWRDVADGRLTPAEPYVFAYILGKEDLARDALIERLAAGRQVIRISDRDDGTELPAGPAEFIDLVDHAALVVTDSFHGSVFATLLATPLVEVPRAGGEHMAGRIDTLVSKLGLSRVPVGEGDALAVPEGVPGGEGARVAGPAGNKPVDVAAPAEGAEAPAVPNAGAPGTAAAPAAPAAAPVAPAAPAEMTQGGGFPGRRVAGRLARAHAVHARAPRGRAPQVRQLPGRRPRLARLPRAGRPCPRRMGRELR